jgi:hypothetical protein
MSAVTSKSDDRSANPASVMVAPKRFASRAAAQATDKGASSERSSIKAEASRSLAATASKRSKNPERAARFSVAVAVKKVSAMVAAVDGGGGGACVEVDAACAEAATGIAGAGFDAKREAAFVIAVETSMTGAAVGGVVVDRGGSVVPGNGAVP